jgi:hypothetical protein
MSITKQALQYVRNTNGNAAVLHFVDDFEPVGRRLWDDMVKQGLVEERDDGRIYLTSEGEAELQG